MDLLEIVQWLLFFFALIEAIPVKLNEYGLSLPETLLACFMIVIFKLTLEVAIIRVCLYALRRLWLKVWSGVKGLFQRYNILMINRWYYNNIKQIDISSFLFGRFEIIYRRPVVVMAKARDNLIKWALGVQYVGLFVLGIVPLPPIIASAGLMTYILLTIKQPWYQFNNLKFACLLAGLEAKIMVVALLSYKIF